MSMSMYQHLREVFYKLQKDLSRTLDNIVGLISVRKSGINETDMHTENSKLCGTSVHTSQECHINFRKIYLAELEIFIPDFYWNWANNDILSSWQIFLNFIGDFHEMLVHGLQIIPNNLWVCQLAYFLIEIMWFFNS